ncbi:MAG: ATP-binding protein [Desulfovibrionales bacterium]
MNTYLERDVRQMVNVRDLSTFQRFLRMCAARTGQLLNLSSLATDCGITHNTAKAWISVLEAGYIVHLLLPHHVNFGKRLIKTPKLYFLDPGLASWLLGIQRSDQLATHPMRGPLFETWVVSEFLKARFHQGKASNLFFWRDRTGHEVDVLIDTGSALKPVEIKSGATVTRDFFSGLRFWQDLSGEKGDLPILVYGGAEQQERSTASVIPWRRIDSIEV